MMMCKCFDVCLNKRILYFLERNVRSCNFLILIFVFACVPFSLGCSEIITTRLPIGVIYQVPI